MQTLSRTLADLVAFSPSALAAGRHGSPEEGLCAMEAVAWLAGEPHSDHPSCSSPVLAIYVRTLNDRMDKKTRDALLRPRLTGLLGSVDPAKEAARAAELAWSSITVLVPRALDGIPGMDVHAAALRALPVGDWSAADSAARSAASLPFWQLAVEALDRAIAL